jgi:hypothetical protein
VQTQILPSVNAVLAPPQHNLLAKQICAHHPFAIQTIFSRDGMPVVEKKSIIHLNPMQSGAS